MKHFLALGALVALAFPSAVFAHASPVEYWPASSATVTEAPEEVRIRFSERVELGASRIKVTYQDGKEIPQGEAMVDANDARVLAIPLAAAEQGAYLVTWSVVSSDDGHFTKGGYTYFIGDAASSGTATAPQVEVVQMSALPEATAMAVELVGNSLLLAAVALFTWILRPRLGAMDEKAKRAALRIHGWLVLFGILFGLSGALAHVLLKSFELASLHGIGLSLAFPLYLGTVSGFATCMRAVALSLFGIVFVLRRTAIVRAPRFSLSEGVLVAALLVFAYFRATVSHATANPFFPEIGIAVNFLHLLAKDLSAGLLIALALLMLAKPLRTHVPKLTARVMRFLALLLVIVGPTAFYIVWLHLKDPANLSSSLWGERFVPLLVSAVLSLMLMAYHIVGSRWARRLVSRFLAYTVPAEAALGMLIVFFSSLMIITSPPLEGKLFSQHSDSQGVSIELARSPHEDGMAVLSFTKHGAGLGAPPTVLLDAEADGGVVLRPEARFLGGYAIPLALFGGNEVHTLTASVAQENGYDARAVFTVSKQDFAPPEEGARSFDLFALLMLMGAVGSIACAFVLFRLVRDELGEEERGSVVRLGVGVAIALLVVSQVIAGVYIVTGNTFKRECIADGNSWHLMLPSRDSRPVSSTPAEGCMALGGAFHIADAREYRFLKSPSPSTVTFDNLDSFVAGVPGELSFSIANEDGTPVRLSVQHERLIHVIVISKDMTQFFHVHPDDLVPLTDADVQGGSFRLPFTFPRAGEYIIGVDYANGLSSRSEQVRVVVTGAPLQETGAATFPLRGSYEGYELSLQPGFPVAGTVATLVWRIQKDGKDVLDLAPYLAAAMHVAIVKDDLSEFVHAHGEVHIPGAPLPKISSTSAHTHAPPPSRFGPLVEAHPVFPTYGDYTVFAQFMHEGVVITAPFSVRVE